MDRQWISSLIIAILINLVIPPSSFAAADAIIREAQTALKKLRYYKLEIDGIVGNNTRKAILQYQYEMNLPITGSLDKTTLKNLMRPSIILNTQDFAPFHYPTLREGEADGPLPQILRLVFNRIGVNCRIFLFKNWKFAQQEVKKGNADGLFVIAWNSQRAEWLHKSIAIVETEYGLYVRNENPLNVQDILQQPAIIDGYTIAAYGPSGTSNSLERLSTTLKSKGAMIKIKLAPDDKKLFKVLASPDTKYAVYSNKIVGESIIKGQGLNDIRYAGRHRGLSYYVGFSKRNVPVETVKKFNEAYLSLVKQGDIQSIMANHNMPLPRRLATASEENASKTESRFVLRDLKGSKVVIDREYCLMWQKSGTTTFYNWPGALSYVEKLNNEHHAGYTDWRLPSVDELRSLINQDRQGEGVYSYPVFDTIQLSCWSGNRSGTDVQYVDFANGLTGSKDQDDTNFARAVRTSGCSE